MKKTIVIFVIAALVILSLLLWALNTRFDLREMLMIVGALILVGFAVWLGVKRVRGSIRKEPVEDEFSKRHMTKASSLAYYISIYLWLVIMYLSDRSGLETHSLIGAGIMGMALVFLFSWIGIRIFGMKNE